jgi:hypothetical protein
VGDKAKIMKLFKYCRSHGLDVIRDLRIYLSHANEFNDPFECAIKFDYTSIGVEDIKRILLSEEYYFTEWCALNPSEEDLDKRRQYYQEHIDEIARERVEDIPTRREMTQRQFLVHASRAFIMGCFSLHDNSVQMWSYYANDHKGIVIEFDGSSEPFTYADCLYEVKYGSERPVFQLQGAEDLKEQFFRCATHKGNSWSHEREVRYIIPKNISVIQQGRFLPIPAKSIVSVTLGCRCPIEYRFAIRAS